MKTFLHQPLWNQLLTLHDELSQTNTSWILVTVVQTVGSNPQSIGAKLLVNPQGVFYGTVGGGKIEAQVLQEVQAFWEDSASFHFVSYNLQTLGMTCGGKMDFFFEKLQWAPTVYVFGGGHVSQPTVSLLRQTGWNVTVIEERMEWSQAERFPGATVICQPYEDFLKDFSPHPTDFLLLLTQGHARDQVILERVLSFSVGFIGMIGSLLKWNQTKKMLQKSGFTEEECNRVTCPVGLPIGGTSPEEIAVSIVSQMIQLRNQK